MFRHHLFKVTEVVYIRLEKPHEKQSFPKTALAIAFDQSGQGPALILVAAATATRLAEAELSTHLAPHFTVFAYDRVAGAKAATQHPMRSSARSKISKLLSTRRVDPPSFSVIPPARSLPWKQRACFPARSRNWRIYEPPFIIDDSRPPVPQDYVSHLNELIAAGRRGEAVEYFMTDVMLVPAEMVAQMRNTPMWPQIEAVAHTIPYDGTIMGDTMSGNPSTLRKWASVTVPTLVMVGGASPAFFHNGAQTLVDILPNAKYRRLAGQDHGPADEVLTPALVEFFESVGKGRPKG